MKTWLKILLAVLAILVLLALIHYHLTWTVFCNMFSPKTAIGETLAWEGGRYERVSYGESESQYIDLYLPDNTENAPLFVIVHGGGFIANDSQSKQARFMIRYFRDHGFACASVNYRLAAEAPFPAACDDVRDAVHFLDEHAADYGYNAEKIGIFGESAGGYLATREALTESQSDIAALVSYYGAYQMESIEEQFREQGIPQWIRSLANGWANGNLGGYDSCEEYWVRKASADWTQEDRNAVGVQYIAENTAENPELQAYLLYGTADITVPYAQSIHMAEALSARYGADHVTLEQKDGMIHADDRMYSDEQLQTLEQFLRTALDTAD